MYVYTNSISISVKESWERWERQQNKRPSTYLCVSAKLHFSAFWNKFNVCSLAIRILNIIVKFIVSLTAKCYNRKL